MTAYHSAKVHVAGIMAVLSFLLLTSCGDDAETRKVKIVIDEGYTITPGVGDVKIYMDLYNTGDYVIGFDKDWEGSCIVMGFWLSNGSYEVKSDTIITHDAVNSFEMIFILNGDSLIAEKGMKFLTASEIKNRGNIRSAMPADEVWINETKEKLQLDIDALRNEDALYKIKPGTYLREDIGRDDSFELDEKGFWLAFNEDGTYTYCIEDRPLSAGTWTTQGRLLTLNDEYLNTKFYMEITNHNALKLSYMPSSYKPYKFYWIPD